MPVIPSRNVGAFTPRELRESLVGESYLHTPAFFRQQEALFQSEKSVNISCYVDVDVVFGVCVCVCECEERPLAAILSPMNSSHYG